MVGSTGSGKSTLLDLFMGLIAPTSGRIVVDGDCIHDPSFPDRIISWRSSIAHVPQNIFLADTSIAENIALGVPKDQIDMARLKNCARRARIAEFIESSPEGYEAFVGERGMKLSGGQRQRIGIARALYKKANILVFDEATSALDSSTELLVMNAIGELNLNYTIIIIAHRLSTLSACNRILTLEDGKVSRILHSNDQSFAEFLSK